MDFDAVLHTRKCFFVGGRYGNTGSEVKGLMFGQMYVEELKPATITRPYPIVFWPGTGSTGSCWVTTPDGRPGWAAFFLSRGYKVYLMDPPERGRSAIQPKSGKSISISQDYAEKNWTATASNSNKWPKADLHTKWPGSGKGGDAVFDQFLASQVQSQSDYLRAEQLGQRAGAVLLDKIGPSILCTHSSGGSHGWLIVDAVPDLVKAIVALEPLGPPFVNRIASTVAAVNTNERKRPYGITASPITYDPPISSAEELRTRTIGLPDFDMCDIIKQADPPRRLANLSKMPVLIVTGESGYHAHYDHATVAYLRQAGVQLEWLNLPEVGVRGNGHFMFLEENSDEIAELVQQWLFRKCQA